jgi:hypothetical protein
LGKNIATILNLLDWQQIFYNKTVFEAYLKIKTIHLALQKNHEFLCKKSAMLNFSASLNIFFVVKDEQLAKFK